MEDKTARRVPRFVLVSRKFASIRGPFFAPFRGYSYSVEALESLYLPQTS
jgi:hypothetical protein